MFTLQQAGAKREFNYLGLTIALFVFTLVFPFLSQTRLSTVLMDVAMTAVLVFSVFATCKRAAAAVAAIALALPAAGLSWASNFMALPHGASMAKDLSCAVFLGFVIVYMTYAITIQPRVTFDTVCGAVCVYLLIGLAWTFLYLALERSNPGAFLFNAKTAGGFNSFEGSVDLFCELDYFSYVTLTTVGFGDITPVAKPARMLAATEAIVGQLFQTVLLARFVGIYISQHKYAHSAQG